MGKTNRVFPTVPLAEVLDKAIEVDGVIIGDKVSRNERPKPNRVLVVDDEHVIADTLGTILGNAGYETAVAYDAHSALRQCEALDPQLIISDVIMPGMNGIEMAILIRQRHPACRILLISGQASTMDLLEEAQRRGYDFELLAKPVHPAELLSKLARLTAMPALNQPVNGVPRTGF